MASDVEVLTWLLKSLRDPVYPSPLQSEDGRRGLDAALMRTISALEAREAQPKVEGRMGDADAAAVEAWLDCRAVACPIGGPVMAAEWRRARASEAALSEKVAALEQALEECRIHHLDPREDSE